MAGRYAARVANRYAARVANRYAARGGPAWFQGRYAANELTYHVCRKSQLLQPGLPALTLTFA